MKNLLRTIKYLALLSVLMVTSCGKDKSSPESKRPITKEDLLGIYIVVEFGYTNQAFYGDKSYLQLVSFTQDNDGLKSNSHQNDVSYKAFINDLVHSPATGVTTVNVHNSIFLPLTRNDDGEIILAAAPSYRSGDYQVRHAELYQVKDAPVISSNAVQAFEGGNGYYSFLNGKWIYALSANFPARTWNYDSLFPYAWRGRDGGAAGYTNFGVTIPEGKGWKGQHKGERLMLLIITDNGVSRAGVVICKMLVG